jgi:hypothetical protein
MMTPSSTPARAARWASVLALVLIVSACGATGPSAAESLIEEVESQLPSLPALNADEIVAEVQANAESECLAPEGVDELFCNQVDFDSITFEDGVLTVPTALEATAVADAEHVCDVFGGSHTNQQTGEPLGFVSIEVLSADGQVAASCAITE